MVFEKLVTKTSISKQLVVVLLICSGIGLLISYLNPVGDLSYYQISFSFSYAFGLCIWGIDTFLVRTRPQFPQHLRKLVAVIAGSLLGITVGILFIENLLGIEIQAASAIGERTFVLGIFFGTLVLYFFYSQFQIMESRTKLEQTRAAQLEQQQQLTQSQLSALQAQIEPHFLFNTLANIHSRIDADPATAKVMLEHLTQLLRQNLSRSRSGRTTLAQELELVESYLGIQALRMGERLHFSIEVPADLRQFPFPPLLLQPLVENAVLHGIEPKVQGGRVSITVEQSSDRIIVAIIDSGVGLQQGESGSGIGLENTRARLKGLYGERGLLSLQENSSGGITATVEIPHG